MLDVQFQIVLHVLVMQLALSVLLAMVLQILGPAQLVLSLDAKLVQVLLNAQFVN